MEISVIIPAYNEEKRISETLLEVNQYLSEKFSQYEIIVVNDGSKDKTAEIVDNLIGTMPALKLIDNKINHGKGYAVKTGMLYAKGNYRLFMDADNAIKIHHLEKFLDYLSNHNVVIGSIELPGSIRKSEYGDSARFYRHLFGKLSKYLVRSLTIWEIHDTQRSFKLFTKDAAEQIFSRQTINRWGFDIELLVIAKKQNHKIKELPVVWINPAGRVKFSDYFKTLRELIDIKLNSFKGKYN